jgi:hypothetical protein
MARGEASAQARAGDAPADRPRGLVELGGRLRRRPDALREVVNAVRARTDALGLMVQTMAGFLEDERADVAHFAIFAEPERHQYDGNGSEKSMLAYLDGLEDQIRLARSRVRLHAHAPLTEAELAAKRDAAAGPFLGFAGVYAEK